MADFSFLNDDDDDQNEYAAEQNKGRMNLPKTVDVPVQPYATSGEEPYSAQGALPPKTESKTDPAYDFQKKRAQAADFAKNETLKGLDRLTAARDARMRSGGNYVQPLDYEGAKSRIIASPPEQYAQRLFEEAQKHDLANDDILRGPEDAVTNYKRLLMQEQPQQEQQLQQQLKAQDVPAIKAQLQSLDQTIERAKQDMSIAATARQKEKLKNDLQFYESQKRQLQGRLPPEPAKPGEIQDTETTIDHALTAAGHPRQDAIQSLTEMRRIVEMSGISPSAPVSALSFIPTYTNLISHIFNPQVRDKMLAELGPPPEEKQQEREPQKSTFGSDRLEQDPRFLHNQAMIDQRENRQQQIMQELANSHTFKNVGDVLGFVLTSFLLGPKVASLFFSNMLKNGNLRDELNRLDHETTSLYHQQNSYIQLAQHARAMAASEEHQKTQEAEAARHHWAVENYMKMKGGDKSFWAPEDKRTDAALQHAYRYQRSTLDTQEKKVMEMSKVIERGPMDPDFKAVQGALGKERQKLAKMRGDFDEWRLKVNEWYRNHGAGDIEGAAQTKQDSFTLPKE